MYNKRAKVKKKEIKLHLYRLLENRKARLSYKICRAEKVCQNKALTKSCKSQDARKKFCNSWAKYPTDWDINKRRLASKGGKSKIRSYGTSQARWTLNRTYYCYELVTVSCFAVGLGLGSSTKGLGWLGTLWLFITCRYSGKLSAWNGGLKRIESGLSY
jgi:hypothetical protein